MGVSGAVNIGPAVRQGLSAGWAAVDVETSGLSSVTNRVLSVSIRTMHPDGTTSDEFHTLLNPGCDPGPVWIHGLTRKRLRGAPRFEDVAARVCSMLDGRVLVAHNAQFDFKFLHAEATRAALEFPGRHRLCTLALSRRLDLAVPDHKLGTLARHWGVPQHAAHDSRDDVRVLCEIFAHSRALAQQLGVALPVLECNGRGAAVYPELIPRTATPYANPRTWVIGQPLVQGMKIVITGPTRKARAILASDLAAHGFDVMNAVSGQTRLVICNEPAHISNKASRARELGIPILTEEHLVRILADVRPGTPKDATGRGFRNPSGGAAEASDSISTIQVSRAGEEQTPRPVGAGTGEPSDTLWPARSVLVIGGTHHEAAQARELLAGLGARVLVNLGSRTTHVLVLTGGHSDRRMPKIRERTLPVLALADLTDTSASHRADCALDLTAVARAVVEMCRGQVIDLPKELMSLEINANWQPKDLPLDVDIVAFAIQSDEQVATDEDFVFYNAPSTPDGGVQLTVDGDCEQRITLDLDALPEGCIRITIAAAIDGPHTFGAVGPIRLTAEVGGHEIAAATLDAATDERTLVLAEVYRRGEVWRLRTVGRGYEYGLGDLATGMGVKIG